MNRPSIERSPHTVAAWFTPKRIAWIVGIGVFVLFAAVVAAGSSPRACSACHGEIAKAQQASAHASTGCYRCHAPGIADKVAFKATELFVMYPAALTGGGLSGPVAETPRDGCLSCHRDVLDEVAPGNSGIRIDHAECAPGATCDSCHAPTAHGKQVRWARQPVMEDCTSCHKEQDASIECDTCHAGKLQTERLAAGPWQVTHGPDWEQVHGMGDLESCSTCHAEDYCVKCHKVEVPHTKTFGSEHGAAAIADKKSCFDCHKSKAYCDSCHGIEMPHPAGFLERHSRVAVNVFDPACERCHAPEDCERCHKRHVHPGFAREAAGLKPPVPGAGDRP